MAKSEETGIDAAGMCELLAGKSLSAEQERKLLAAADPAQHPGLLELYASRLRKLGAEHDKLQAEHARLHEPPLHPGTVLRSAVDARVEVSVGGRRQLVPVAGGAALAELRTG